MSPFEQLESRYQIQLPEDFLTLRARVEKSGALTLTDEYEILDPDDIVMRKPGVLWPELIPVIQNRYDGCAICLRAPLVQGEGYFWDWFDGETAKLTSLGRDFSAVLRTIMVDLYRASFEDSDPARASALLDESRRMAEIPGVVPDKRDDLVKEFMDGGEASCVTDLRNACGIRGIVSVLHAAEADDARQHANVGKAIEILREVLAGDPRFLNAHWCLGALEAARGRPDVATRHFTHVAEREWGRMWPAHNLVPCAWHTDLAVVADFLLRNADLYKLVSLSPIIGEVFASGAAADGTAWEQALEKSVKSGDWFTARIIALNGMIDARWPPGGWPEEYNTRCAQALVLACHKLGFAGRVEGLLNLWK